MKSKMLKKSITVLVSVSMAAALITGCNKKAEVTSEPASVAVIDITPGADTSGMQETSETVSEAVPETALETAPVISPAAAPESASETAPEKASESGREDGERFEDTIILEGMEETVKYEHVKNAAIGFAMDYDYESFTRQSGDTEKFISVYDDAAKPENYLEIKASSDDADTALAAIADELSGEYEVETIDVTLDKAGNCRKIDASVIKGTNNMADQLQVVYVIPAANGSIIATEHFAIEASEGFGRRFNYMLQTLEVLK